MRAIVEIEDTEPNRVALRTMYAQDVAIVLGDPDAPESAVMGRLEQLEAR